MNEQPAPSKSAVYDAANTLIFDVEAHKLYGCLLRCVELQRDNIPVALTGRAAIMNALLELHLHNPDNLDNVVALVNRKREELNQPPLSAEDDESSDGAQRKKYMREFMASKREKQATLVRLWNELRADADQLRGTARLEFERIHAARWQDEKKRREEALRERLGRRLSLKERTDLATRLWDDVQEELAALAAFVQTEIRKPLHARARGGFVFRLGQLKDSKQ